MGKKYVFLLKEGNKKMINILGGKGSNLCEMTKMGLPVPQGFIVSTEACGVYYDNYDKFIDTIISQTYAALLKIEKSTQKGFGNNQSPLLLSVRSGARVSMPGMMDSILNLGLNDEVVQGLANLTSNQKFAYDSYRRFITMYADVVMGIDRLKFENALEKLKKTRGVQLDAQLLAEDFKQLVNEYKNIYKNETGGVFPQDAKTQLVESIKAVFRSWNNPRADVYRRINDIPHDWGTAVIVQEMVFGNMGEESGTGVAFTRNPSTGENILYGEYLMNAQGEDVVAGIRTPHPISKLKEQNEPIFKQFSAICIKLEKHYKDMQDLEFTIENGKLFILQTRSGKRTAAASLKIAIDLVNEKVITKKQAILSINPKSLDGLLHPAFDDGALKKAKELAHGLAASPGAAYGQIALTSEKAKQMFKDGKSVILVRSETSPEDIEGMSNANGVLTATGGMTSHAAVVARGMGRACVVGCANLSIRKNEIKLGEITFKEGDVISIDGTSGKIYAEQIPTKEIEVSGDFATIMSWADEFAQVKVRANADNEADATRALSLGAEGIGLCRTEHMFFDSKRIKAFREMIITDDEKIRDKALSKILPMQKNDFVSLFKTMHGLPVTVRLLDPPLHEFLPTEEKDIKELAADLNKNYQQVKDIIKGLHEFNPMMGFRGCRLTIVMPEIAKMQTTAVIEAAIECVKKHKVKVCPEIMVPLIGDVKELKYVKNIITQTADELIEKSGIKINYFVGTMIEIPRAAITAKEIAKEADFFSFGTNDLTQMTYGFSRDDSSKFIDQYYDKHILDYDPFVRIDETGVGYLMEKTIKDARKVKKNFECGICGEQGADPLSVQYAHKIGVDYVSCSPFRVPIAKLASAQAAIKSK